MNFSRNLFVYAAAVLVFAASSITQAATFTVTQNADCAVGSGACCLRTAVWAANHPGTFACGQTSTGNNDIIQLGGPNATALTINPALSAIEISRPMTIQGNYQGAHADNNTVKITGAYGGVFRVAYEVPTLQFNLKYLNITGSDDIDMNGSAVNFTYLPSDGGYHKVALHTVRIDNCTGWLGGAIFALNAYVDIDGDALNKTQGSYIHHNQSAYGGAIYHDFSGLVGLTPLYLLTINNTTFENNYANQNGGSGDGGAIYHVSVPMKLSNSIFGGSSSTGNKAGCGQNGCTGRGLGGAIYKTGQGACCISHIINTTFSYNQASASGSSEPWSPYGGFETVQGLSGGGAIFTDDDIIFDSGNVFANNSCTRVAGSTAQCLGGAILADANSYMDVYSSASFTGNTVATGGYGGAVYSSANVSAQNNTSPNSTFSGNSSACNIDDGHGVQKNGYCGFPSGDIQSCPSGLVGSCQDRCGDSDPSQCGSVDRTEGGSAAGTGTPCNATTETVAKAYDNRMTSGNFSKWCVTSAPNTGTPISAVYDFAGTDSYRINRYTLTTGNDNPSRDPKNWTFQGCTGTCPIDGTTGWVTLDTQTNQFAGAARYQTNSYKFSNITGYEKYRLRFTANNGATNRFQLAEIQIFEE